MIQFRARRPLHALPLLLPGLALLLGLCLARPANAVLLIGKKERNLAAPMGALAGSGWQYQGQWGAFIGTPIAPHFFVAATHTGGAVGQKLQFAGAEYTTVARFDAPGRDLTIWRVKERFPRYAPLFTGSDEVNRNAVIFGRGTKRGKPVTLPKEKAPKGWYWGAGDGALSWGENRIATVVRLDPPGAPALGDLLAFTFDKGAGPNECHLSGSDSGGGVFIKDNGIWKLAGINHAVESMYSFQGSDGDAFNASIFDARGLYVGRGSQYRYVPLNLPAPRPGYAVATRISSNMGFIKSVTGIPEPGTMALVSVGLLPFAGALFARRRKKRRE